MLFLLNVYKVDEEPGVGGTGLDVVVVVEGGVEDGTKVVYPSGPAPKATWEQCGGAAVLIVQILHRCAELVDGVLAAPVAAVVTSKEEQIRVLCLQHRTELTKELLLLVVWVLALQDYTDVDVLWAEA